MFKFKLQADTIFSIIVAVFVIAMIVIDPVHVLLLLGWTLAVAAVIALIGMAVANRG